MPVQAGEIVVAKLKGGPTLVRCLASPTLDAKGGGRVRVSVGRNREAQLPGSRIVLATGVVASDADELDEFRRRSEDVASDLDLSEVWDVVREETASVSLDSLADLLWGPANDAAQRVALLLHIERNPLYFVGYGEGYKARKPAEVREIESRRQREAERAGAVESLMGHLSRGELPPEMTPLEASLLGHLRGFAVHGDDYTRGSVARELLQPVAGATRDLQRLSFDLLVEAGVLSADEPLELERAGIPRTFSPGALAEAAELDLDAVLAQESREDLTDLPTVTIDDADTRDRDDALSLEVVVTQDTTTYRVAIHIADAGALVAPDGPLDRDADERMASLYLPELKIPMLPPEISSGLGSLHEREKRPALSVLAEVSDDGEVFEWRVSPSVVRSDAALSYEEADAVIGGADHPLREPLIALDRLARSLRGRREERGALLLDRVEMIVSVEAPDRIEVKVLREPSPAREMVAELMIFCNTLLAELCRRNELPAAYRTQPAPDLAEAPAGDADGPLRRYLMCRGIPPAVVSTSPGPHGGLGVEAYIQSTSPLRRYSELIMQRQISRFLESGEPFYGRDAMGSIAQRAEVQRRELSRLEEDRKRYWLLKLLDQRRAAGDDTFEAVVLENQPQRPALLELTEYPFRLRAALPDTCAPGDSVDLRLHGVDLWRRTGQFVHLPGSG